MPAAPTPSLWKLSTPLLTAAALWLVSASPAAADPPVDAAAATEPGAAVAADKAVDAAVDAATDGAVRSKLDERAGRFVLADAPLDQGLVSLCQAVGVEVRIDANAIRGVGLNPATPISLSLQSVSLGRALSVALAEASAGGVELGYAVRNGAVVVSSREALEASSVETCVFDPGPAFGAARKGPGRADDDAARAERDRSAEAAARVIRATVAPDRWHENGGTVASVQVLGDQLIVTATPEMLDDVAAMLDRLERGSPAAPPAAPPVR